MADSTAPEPDDQTQSSVPNDPGSASSGVDDEGAQALESAVDTVNQIRQETEEATGIEGSDTEALRLPEFGKDLGEHALSGIDLLSQVNLNVRIELGRTRMLVEDVLRLNEGSVVELDKLAGDPVDIYVNDRLVACGEVLVLNDAFSVRINEILGKPGSVLDDLQRTPRSSVKRAAAANASQNGNGTAGTETDVTDEGTT